MDPNIALERIGEALRSGDMEEAREARGHLKGWLARGGFKPDWSRDHVAASYYRTGKIPGVARAQHRQDSKLIKATKVKIAKLEKLIIQRENSLEKKLRPYARKYNDAKSHIDRIQGVVRVQNQDAGMEINRLNERLRIMGEKEFHT